MGHYSDQMMDYSLMKRDYGLYIHSSLQFVAMITIT